MLLGGKPVPDNRADATRRLSDHIHENRHSSSYEDEMLTIKSIPKETAHIMFKSRAQLKTLYRDGSLVTMLHNG